MEMSLRRGAAAVLMAMLAIPGAALASTVTYTPTTEFSGSGSTYSGTITYTLEDVTGGVLFTIDWEPVTNTTEFLSGAYLNVDPAVNPTTITASGDTCTGCAFLGFSAGTDAFKPDGDGFFDLLFEFEESASGRFNQGDGFSVLLSGSSITANSFVFQSVSGGGGGTWYAVARVQGLSNGSGSGWFGDNEPDAPPDVPGVVPEPASLILLGTGLAGIALSVRRHKRR